MVRFSSRVLESSGFKIQEESTQHRTLIHRDYYAYEIKYSKTPRCVVSGEYITSGIRDIFFFFFVDLYTSDTEYFKFFFNSGTG